MRNDVGYALRTQTHADLIGSAGSLLCRRRGRQIRAAWPPVRGATVPCRSRRVHCSSRPTHAACPACNPRHAASPATAGRLRRTEGPRAQSKRRPAPTGVQGCIEYVPGSTRNGHRKRWSPPDYATRAQMREMVTSSGLWKGLEGLEVSAHCCRPAGNDLPSFLSTSA